MPGYVTRFIGGEKQRRVRDVPGVARLAERYLRIALANHFFYTARAVRVFEWLADHRRYQLIPEEHNLREFPWGHTE